MPRLHVGKTPGVESARKLLNVLFSFTEDRPKITLEDVVQLSQISVPSAYRYLSLLRELGIIEERSRGEFSLTARVLQLADAVQLPYDLEEITRPAMEDLVASLGESVLLLTTENAQAKCISIIQPDGSLILSFTPGQYFPFERGAAPKLLLAFAPESFQKDYISKHVSDKHAAITLIEDLKNIRESGHAVSAGEVDQGIWATATPILFEQNVVASLTVAGPAFRIPDEKKIEIHESLVKATEAINSELSALID